MLGDGTQFLGWDLLRDLSPTFFVVSLCVYGYFVITPLVLTAGVILRGGEKIGFVKALVVMALSVMWSPMFALFGPVIVPFLLRHGMKDGGEEKVGVTPDEVVMNPPSWFKRKRMKLVREKLNGGTHPNPPGAA